MKVTLITYTPFPEKTIAASAKLCYSNSLCETLLDNLDKQKTEKFIDMLSDLGHESPIEHANFTFAIEGVSRTLLAQITRHRLASFSVQSQRYVKKDNFEYIIPPEITKDNKAAGIFENQMKSSLEAYNKLVDILQSKHYQNFIKQEMSEKQAMSKAEKKAIEDARFVLPNACDTKMIVTMNARSLMNFFKLRCCARAQWEIKAVADRMLEECVKVAPILFKNAGAACVNGSCPEGKMSCGQSAQVREFYKNLKANAIQ